MGKRFKRDHKRNKNKGSHGKPRDILTIKEPAIDAGIKQKEDVSPKKRIVVLTHSSPMRFNRAFFQMAANQMQEQSFNYYLATKIMQPVRNITEYPNFRELQRKFLRGAFKAENADPPPITVKEIDPELCLQDNGDFDYRRYITGQPCSTETLPFDLLVEDRMFHICKPFEIEGEWRVLYFLYRVYELSGFGDLAIDGQPYRIRFHPSPTWKEDLILAKQNNKLVIGRLA